MKRFSLAMLAMVLVFGAFATTYVGCKGSSEPTYTVWAGTMPYSEWAATFGQTMDDNHYGRVEYSNSEWNQYKAILDDLDEYKHDWTEEQIYVWFLESTFGQARARELATWLITVGHGGVALRRGLQAHVIAK